VTGTAYPEGEDLLRVDMKVSQTQSVVENFTIAYHKKDVICAHYAELERTQAQWTWRRRLCCRRRRYLLMPRS